MTSNTAATTAPRMYQQLTPLHREQHANLKLKPGSDLSCAADLLLIPIVSSEFFDTAREYPIVFVTDARQILMAVAVTGTPGGKNLFIDAQGKWQGNYVPAYLRNHPFALARTAPETITVCIDAEFGGLNASEGEPLFAAGAPTAMLQDRLKRLDEYEALAQFTVGLVQRLEAAGLLIDADASADVQGHSFSVNGFKIIDEAKLRALPEATVKAWFASGELGLIYAHLISLGNFLQLLQRQSLAATANAVAST
jgi:SapC